MRLSAAAHSELKFILSREALTVKGSTNRDHTDEPHRHRGKRPSRNWRAKDRIRFEAVRGELTKILPEQPRPFLPNWIRSLLPELKGAPLSVLCSYISHANRSGIAWPAIPTLCRETGYGHCAVDAARAFLVQAGILRRLGQEFNNGRRGKTKFQLTWHI
jgi:hypothetical protein